MSGMKLSELEFLRLLPSFMKGDEAVIALSGAMDDLIGTPGKRVPTLRVWDQIDNLNDAELDELAWELDVDWYDSTLSIDEKRETIKLARQIKRKRGTKWAVEHLVASYLGSGFVAEWYEIDGSPFTFVVMTTNADLDPESYAKFMKMAAYAKNARSHIAGVFYYWEQGPEGIETRFGQLQYQYGFKLTGTIPGTATIGTLLSKSVNTLFGSNFYSYSFVRCGTRRCGQ